MAHTASWFGRAQEGQYGGTAARRVDWVADTLKNLLTLNAFAHDVDAHDFKDDVTNEITGTGYTAGGVALGGKTVTYDTGTNETRLDCNDIEWGPGATITARKSVTYKDTGTASTSPLLGIIVFEADESITNGTFRIQVDATGLLKTVVI